jgi:SAM-dependent methyltransferase
MQFEMQARPDASMKTIRDHDKFYLQEDRKLQPKEYFKFIMKRASLHLSRYSNCRVVEVGCATGDLAHYIKSLHPTVNHTGVDVMEPLLERARKEVPGCHFIQGDICDPKILALGRFDAVFMVGVHMIFDSLSPWLDNLIQLADLEKGARIFLFGMFNPEDVDVLTKVRYADLSNDHPWQAGWNCISIKSVTRYAKKLGITSVNFEEFKINMDLPRHPDDPLRSWTFRYEDGSRGIINGSGMLHRLFLATIER